MAEADVTYGDLEDVLLSFGFEKTVTSTGQHLFKRPASDAYVILQPLPRNRPAHHFHWMMVQGTLDDFGFLPRDEFFDAVRKRRAVS
ncbi:MAG: hypothetical protein ACJ8F7_02550 [Gemmataceae bacterium]